MNLIKIRLKELRIERNLKQSELANILNISTTCYAGYEQGYREPNANMIIKICTYFNVSSDYLLGLEDIDGRKIEQSTQTINDNRKYSIRTKNHRGDINIK